MRNAGLDEAQAGSKIAGRNINNLVTKPPPPEYIMRNTGLAEKYQ